jgi:hypothetical protein
MTHSVLFPTLFPSPPPFSSFPFLFLIQPAEEQEREEKGERRFPLLFLVQKKNLLPSATPSSYTVHRTVQEILHRRSEALKSIPNPCTLKPNAPPPLPLQLLLLLPALPPLPLQLLLLLPIQSKKISTLSALAGVSRATRLTRLCSRVRYTRYTRPDLERRMLLLLFSWLLFLLALYWREQASSVSREAKEGRGVGEAIDLVGLVFREGEMAEECIWTGLTPGNAWSAFM